MVGRGGGGPPGRGRGLRGGVVGAEAGGAGQRLRGVPVAGRRGGVRVLAGRVREPDGLLFFRLEARYLERTELTIYINNSEI